MVPADSRSDPFGHGVSEMAAGALTEGGRQCRGWLLARWLQELCEERSRSGDVHCVGVTAREASALTQAWTLRCSGCITSQLRLSRRLFCVHPFITATVHCCFLLLQALVLEAPPNAAVLMCTDHEFKDKRKYCPHCMPGERKSKSLGVFQGSSRKL